MKHPSPSELRELLALMKEYGIPETTIQQTLLGAARRYGIPTGRTFDSVAEFVEQWRNEEIPLPLVACMSSDLYAAYLIWAGEHNKPLVSNERVFGKELSGLDIHVFHTSSGSVVDPTGEINSVISEAVASFRSALEAYRNLTKKKGSRK